MSLNKVIIQGRLTKDVEGRVTQNGVSVATFTVAVDRNVKSGEKKADFINCIAFKNTADFIGKYFSKGKPILVEGMIQTRNYKNQEGKTVYVTEVIANNVYFCGGDKNKAEDETESIDFLDDELPF